MNGGRVARTNAFEVMFRAMMVGVDVELAPHVKRPEEIRRTPTVVLVVHKVELSSCTYASKRFLFLTVTPSVCFVLLRTLPTGWAAAHGQGGGGISGRSRKDRQNTAPS